MNFWETNTIPMPQIVQGKTQSRQCIDAGSAYCPCRLAELGECIACAVMRGETGCDCSWSGVCVAQHARWQGEHVRSRRSVEVPVLDMVTLSGDVVVVKVGVPPALAAELRLPGSFVFLRGDESLYFDVPLAVLSADLERQELLLAYQVVGPKTKLLNQGQGKVWLRGPYWNGINGRRLIETSTQRECLLVAGGMAASTIPNLARFLLSRGNRVSVVLGAEKSQYVIPYLPLEHTKLSLMDFPRDRGLLALLMRELQPQLVFCGGRGPLWKMTAELSAALVQKTDFTYSVEQNMCCGEGLCGACVEIIDGVAVRACKTVH